MARVCQAGAPADKSSRAKKLSPATHRVLPTSRQLVRSVVPFGSAGDSVLHVPPARRSTVPPWPQAKATPVWGQSTESGFRLLGEAIAAAVAAPVLMERITPPLPTA